MNTAREYLSPLVEELLNETTPEERERINMEMEATAGKVELNKDLFAFIGWLMLNTHVHSETGLTMEDGYAWYNYMWNKWLENSDAGQAILKNKSYDR